MYAFKAARILQLCIIAGILMLVHTLASAQTLQKPIEGDSLSYAVFMTSGIGWMTYDVEQLNTSLKNSKLNTVEDNAMFVGIDTKLPVGKGFLFGSGFYYAPEIARVTNDTGGSIRTSLSSFGASLNLGYSIVHNKSFLLFPSVGFGFGLNLTKIEQAENIWFGMPGATIRDQLNSSQSREVENSTININLNIGIEAYVKLFGFGVQENDIQDKPNTPVKAQTRGEIWIGGFASYNPCLTSTTTNGTVNNDSYGFTPSGLHYGIRLMATTALRYILP